MDQREPANGNELELSQVLASLRTDLAAAQKAGETHDVRFLMDDIEIELHVSTSGTMKAEGGIKFWVLNLGSEVKGEDKRIQKIKVKMKAVDKQGKPLLVSRADTRG